MSEEVLTWHCEVCRKERLDKDISVLTLYTVLPGNIKSGRNLKFCNDDILCFQQGAEMVIDYIHDIERKFEKENDKR